MKGCWPGSATSGTFYNASPDENDGFGSGFSDLKRVIAGKDLPEDVKSQLVALHEEVGVLKEQYKESQDKLSKAKVVRTNLARGFISLADCDSSSSNLRISFSKRNRRRRAEELARYVNAEFHPRRRSLMSARRAYTRSPKQEPRSWRKKSRDLRFVFDPSMSLKTFDDNPFIQRLLVEQRARFEKEVHLLLGFIHSFGMNTMRDLAIAGCQQESKSHPNSWLAQQRSDVRGSLVVKITTDV